jgi:hypothetical protein
MTETIHVDDDRTEVIGTIRKTAANGRSQRVGRNDFSGSGIAMPRLTQGEEEAFLGVDGHWWSLQVVSEQKNSRDNDWLLKDSDTSFRFRQYGLHKPTF